MILYQIHWLATLRRTLENYIYLSRAGVKAMHASLCRGFATRKYIPRFNEVRSRTRKPTRSINRRLYDGKGWPLSQTMQTLLSMSHIFVTLLEVLLSVVTRRDTRSGSPRNFLNRLNGTDFKKKKTFPQNFKGNYES